MMAKVERHAKELPYRHACWSAVVLAGCIHGVPVCAEIIVRRGYQQLRNKERSSELTKYSIRSAMRLKTLYSEGDSLGSSCGVGGCGCGGPSDSACACICGSGVEAMVVRVLCHGRNRNALNPRWSLPGMFRFSNDFVRTEIINPTIAKCRILL
jgi:hypothetical protein